MAVLAHSVINNKPRCLGGLPVKQIQVKGQESCPEQFKGSEHPLPPWRLEVVGHKGLLLNPLPWKGCGFVPHVFQCGNNTIVHINRMQKTI